MGHDLLLVFIFIVLLFATIILIKIEAQLSVINGLLDRFARQYLSDDEENG